MGQFLLGIFITCVLGFGFSYILWWGIMIVSFVVGFFLQMNGLVSFLAGSISGAICFGVHAYVIDSMNESKLSTMMNEILGFDTLMATIILGLLLGGLGMLTGKYFRDIFGEKKKDKYRGRLK